MTSVLSLDDQVRFKQKFYDAMPFKDLETAAYSVISLKLMKAEVPPTQVAYCGKPITHDAHRERGRGRQAMESTDINLYAKKHIVHQKFLLLWNVDHSCYRVTKEHC